MPVLQKLLPLALPTLVLHRWHGLPYPEFPLVHRPHHFLPNTLALQTGMSERQIEHRDTYWHGALVLEVILGMAVAEICRLAITASRYLIHHCRPDHGHQLRQDHPYSQLPSETGAASADTAAQTLQQEGGTSEANPVVDKSVMDDRAAVVLHVAYQMFCASVALGAYKTDSLSLSSGLDFEWWGLFVLVNMLDGVLQSVLRSVTMPIQELENSFTQFVAPKVALSVVPGLSDRVDIQFDWAFVAVVLQRLSVESDRPLRLAVVMLIAGAGILVIVYAYSKIYTNPPLRSELRADFFTILEPSEKDAVGVMDVARDFKDADAWGTFALQSLAKLASPAKQAIAKFEDVPQAVLKLLFIILISGLRKAGPFLWFTALFSLVKAALLPVLWRRLLRGLPLRTVLRKLSSTDNSGEVAQLLAELRARISPARARKAATAEFTAAVAKLSHEEQTKLYIMATLLSDDDFDMFLSDIVLQALALVLVPPSSTDEQRSRTQVDLLYAAVAQAQAEHQESEPPQQLRLPQAWDLLEHPTPALRAAAADALKVAGQALRSHYLAGSLKQWLGPVRCSRLNGEMLRTCTSLLHPILSDGASDARESACNALGSLASAPSATPELLKEWFATLQPLLTDGGEFVREAAWKALGQTVSAPSASPELLKESFAKLLGDRDSSVRVAACKVLGQAVSAPSATPELLKESFAALQTLLADGESMVRCAACEAVVQTASASSASPELLKESLAALQPFLGDGNELVRIAACRALGQTASAPSASPQLLKESFAVLQPLLRDQSEFVRSAASKALEGLKAAG